MEADETIIRQAFVDIYILLFITHTDNYFRLNLYINYVNLEITFTL